MVKKRNPWTARWQLRSELLQTVFQELNERRVMRRNQDDPELDWTDFPSAPTDDSGQDQGEGQPSPTPSADDARRKAEETAEERIKELEKEARDRVPGWDEIATKAIDSMVTKVGSSLDQLDQETVLPFLQSMPKSPKLDKVVKSYTRAADDYEKSLDNLKPLPRPANVTDAPKIMKQPKLRKRVNTKKFY